jgi:hypothetical protein
VEKVAGPFNGFYIASYVWPSADGQRYTSYAKICRRRPDSYWEAECIYKLFGGERHSSEAAALATANLVAREQIDHLPSLECSTFGLDLPDSRRCSALPA